MVIKWLVLDMAERPLLSMGNYDALKGPIEQVPLHLLYASWSY